MLVVTTCDSMGWQCCLVAPCVTHSSTLLLRMYVDVVCCTTYIFALVVATALAIAVLTRTECFCPENRVCTQKLVDENDAKAKGATASSSSAAEIDLSFFQF